MNLSCFLTYKGGVYYDFWDAWEENDETPIGIYPVELRKRVDDGAKKLAKLSVVIHKDEYLRSDEGGLMLWNTFEEAAAWLDNRGYGIFDTNIEEWEIILQ